MSRRLSGSPVSRYQVFVLDDGNPVVQLSETRVQEIYSGRVRSFDLKQFGHPITDYELDQLKSQSAVEHYTRQYVWVFALPEQSRFVSLRTIDAAYGRTRTYYLNTTLPEAELDEIIALLGETFSAAAHEGLIAVLAPDLNLYDTVADAEAAQQVLTAISDRFENTAVAFLDQSLIAVNTDPDEALDLDALIAGQSATEVTAGKRAAAVCRDEVERQLVQSALQSMQIEVIAAADSETIFQWISEVEDVWQPDLLVTDSDGDELISAFGSLPLIVIGDDPDQAAVTRPLNVALLRQQVYEALKQA